MLIISGNTEVQRKEILMRNLLSPVFSKVSCLAERLAQEQDPGRQVCIMHNKLSKCENMYQER